MKTGIKRIGSNINSLGTPIKVPVMESKELGLKRHEVCQVCKHRVFILERLIVDGKLYHTTCFRCSKCKSLLNPGAYVESDTPGLYECSVCLPDENMDSFDTPETEISSENTGAKSRSPSPRRLSPVVHNEISTKLSPLSESVTRARSSFLKNSLSSKLKEEEHLNDTYQSSSNLPLTNTDTYETASALQRVSVKDKINAFESSTVPKAVSSSPVAAISSNNNKFHTSSIPLAKETFSSLTKSPKPSDRSHKLSDFAQEYKLVDSEFDEISYKSSIKKVSNQGINTDVKILDSVKKESLSLSIQSTVASPKEEYRTNCDSSLSLFLNKVPSTNAKNMSNIHNDVAKQPVSKDLDTSSTSFSKQPSLKSDFKSPQKAPRDIFQTSMQPLKLSIPSVKNSGKKESSSLSTTPSIASADSPRSLNFEIPSIKSTYSVTLPRPSSFSNLQNREISNITKNSTTDLNDILHSKWSRTTRRRSSLESSVKDKSSTEESSHAASFKIPSKTFDRAHSLSEIKRSNSVALADNIVGGTDVKTEKLVKKNASISCDTTSTPIPAVRSSLELKKLTSRKSNLSNAENKNLSENKDQLRFGENLHKNLKETFLSNSSITKNDEGLKSVIDKSLKNEVPKVKETKLSDSGESYPDDLNPFGDEEDDKHDEEYPDDLNPFGDDGEEEEKSDKKSSFVKKAVLVDDYDESKNPFASDEEEEDMSAKDTSPVSKAVHQDRSPFQQNGSYPYISSPTGSLRGTTKKRPAPRPPKLSDIFHNESMDSEADISLSSSRASPSVSRKLQQTPSPSLSKKSLQTPSPKIRKNKPAPPPPPTQTTKQNSQNDSAANSKHMKEIDNMKLKSSASDIQGSNEKEPPKQYKKKKRPAPPVPIPVRKDMKKIPLKEILQEMKEIEEKQREYERQGREIELLIRDRDKDEEPSVEEEEYIMQLFELVNQKNALFRRQAELMYIKRSQRLEEQQQEVDAKIRQLQAKPESERTEEDKSREEELMMELIDIVDQRNSIIDSIEMDRRRELEEDVSVQEQLEIKQAEIKEKSSGKSKKSKNKKDKKKQEAGNGSGNNTLKKKKWL
ncbi:MICAL-like protein 1 isoform X2 [Stegodyphus dumicola]|uniref:MICAL-like protein 1 isoform X2 n=1 Tax=Stegodyphus dumicola TaxID=202533 RepID=UPI0015B0CD4E|nr:MICAL-like protein 1 isoform X2 [Stegodyphus dumicola]